MSRNMQWAIVCVIWTANAILIAIGCIEVGFVSASLLDSQVIAVQGSSACISTTGGIR